MADNPSWDQTNPVEAPPTWDQTQSPEDLYGGVGGMAKAALAGSLRGGSFGLSDQLLTKSGMATPEELKGLSEQNPISSNVGEVGTVLGLASLGDEGNLVNLVSRMGHGVEAGSAGLGLGKIASKAIGYGSEGAAYGLGQSVSEDALGDHDLVSEKTLANIGLSAALMGGVGILVGKYGSKGVSAASRDTSSAADKFEAQKVANSAVPGSDASVITQTGMPAEDQLSFIRRFGGELKPDAESLRSEFKENGLPEVLGMMSKNQTVQKIASAVSQLPTMAGDAVRRDIDEGFGKIESLLKDSLGGGEHGLDPAESGATAKQQILDEFEARNNPLKERYAEREALGQTLKLPDDEVVKFYDSLKDEESKFKNVTNEGRTVIKTAAEDFIKEASHEAGASGTSAVSNLDAFAKSLAEKARAATRAGNHDIAEAYNLVRNRVSDFVDKQMIASEKELGGLEGALGDSGVRDVIAEHKALKADYRDFQNTMAEFIGDTRLGKKARTGRGLSEVLAKIPDEKFIGKVFDPRNAKGLERLKEKWPSVYETLAAQYKSQLWQDSRLNKTFNHLELLKNITNEKKISSGVRKLLFTPDQLEKMEVAKRWIKNLPPKVGPSGTPEGLEYMQMAKTPIRSLISHGMNELGSAAMKKGIEILLKPEEAAQLKTLLNIEKTQNKTNKGIESGVKSLFERGFRPGSAKAASKISTLAEFNEKAKGITGFVNNSGEGYAKISGLTNDLYAHAPGISGAMQMSAMRGMSFLASKLPPTATPSPGLFKDTQETSQAEISKFNRYYSVVEDPLNSLAQVKDGTLMPETLETLSAVYPKLYQEMKQKMVDQLTSTKDLKLSYSTKMGMSAFLGEPLTQSLTPSAILANQQSLAITAQQNAQPQGGNPKASKAGMGKLTVAQRSGVNQASGDA